MQLRSLFFALTLAALPADGKTVSGKIAADAVDAFGETIGGLGSGLCLDEKTGHVFMVSDRGPGDGEIDYAPRFHEVKVSRKRNGKLRVVILKTTRFTDANGQLMTGLIPDSTSDDHPQMKDGRWCIDPEAIALAADGSFYVSDEYGPFLYQFNSDGKWLRTLRPPDYYLPRNNAGKILFGEQNDLASGRIANRGFEGMTLSADGKTAWLVLQGPLAQDGGKNGDRSRLLQLDLVTGNAVQEFSVELHPTQPGTGKNGKRASVHLSELLRIDDGHFLVIERDNRKELPAYKTVQSVDIRGADNILGKIQIPFGAKSRSGNPVLDLTKLPLPGWLPEKWEGLALMPASATGHRQLLIATDNDFLTPTLQINGSSTPFPRGKKQQDTLFFLTDLPDLFAN